MENDSKNVPLPVECASGTHIRTLSAVGEQTDVERFVGYSRRFRQSYETVELNLLAAR